jgi:hypothetical protein
MNEFKLAAEGFATIKEQSILSSLINVEINSSDPESYCTDLSQVFYQELFQSMILYYQLFDEMKENTEIITGLLLQWIQSQMSVYVQMLIRCIFFTVNDQITVLLVHLKDANNYSRILDTSNSQQTTNANTSTSNVNPFAEGGQQPPQTTGDSNTPGFAKRKTLFRAESTIMTKSKRTLDESVENMEEPQQPPPPQLSRPSNSMLLLRSVNFFFILIYHLIFDWLSLVDSWKRI